MRRWLYACSVFLLLCAWPVRASDLFYACNGTGQEMAHPALYPQGPTLMLSNGPESVVSSNPLTLYRDNLSGSFRIFLHHTDKSGVNLQVGVAFTNTGARTCHVALNAAGPGLPFIADADPTMAGAKVFSLWLESKADERFGFDLSPGDSHWISLKLVPGATVTGMIDGVADQPVTVSVVSGDILPPDPTVAPMAPLGAPFRRGTFPHGDRVGEVNYEANVLSWMDVGSPPKGQWSRVSPGEYETGKDATTGQDVYNDGNFGVVYRLQVHVPPHPVPCSVMLDAAGGLSRFVVAVDGRPYVFPGRIRSYQAWRFLRLDADGGDFQLAISVPGGSNGAARLYFVPQTAEADLVGKPPPHTR